MYLRTIGFKIYFTLIKKFVFFQKKKGKNDEYTVQVLQQRKENSRKILGAIGLGEKVLTRERKAE